MNSVEKAYELGYRMSLCGLINSPYNGQIEGWVNNRGYRVFSIRINGLLVKIPAHRLQAYQKYKDAMFEHGIVVRHLDGNKLNNFASNISIGTQSENMKDIPVEERVRVAKHASSFLKKYNNIKIIEFYKKSKSYTKTMSHFGISSKGTLHYILNN